MTKQETPVVTLVPPVGGAGGDNMLRGSSPFKQITSSSRYKGVTLHRRTGRWESHIWVRETGRQLYLGVGGGPGCESELSFYPPA